MRQYKNHILSSKSVIVIFNDAVIPVSDKNKCYPEVLKAIEDRRFNELANIINIESKVNHSPHNKKKSFTVKDGVVRFKDGKEVPGAISTKLIQFLDNGVDIEPIVKFWDNLRRNPQLRSREELYNFLEKNKIPLTEDGCFICYKAVREDFKDCHSGTFLNRPGLVVSIPWEKVDPNCNNICSYGLHVAAFPYADGFKPKDGHLLEVKVNPRHVVSVPTDSNAQKVRVCQYLVMHEVGKQGEQPDSFIYSSRTYYYKGDRRKDRPFNPRLVTSHKPNRIGQTCRAKSLEEAVTEFKEWYGQRPEE